MDSFARHIHLMARYNALANETLLDAIATLEPAAWAAPRGAFFGSMMGTMNHLLVGDRAWFSRMSGTPYPWFTGLDQILHADFADFRQARRQMDETILSLVPTLPTDGDLSYVNSKGVPQVVPWRVVLGHVFNHQTHHRGQVHTLISQSGIEPPPLDLLYFPHGWDA